MIPMCPNSPEASFIPRVCIETPEIACHRGSFPSARYLHAGASFAPERLMMDRSLTYAVVVSLAAHGLVLGFGGGKLRQEVEAPRVLEARLTPEPPPARLPEPPRPQPVKSPAALAPQRQVNTRSPQAQPHAKPVPHLMTAPRADAEAPAVSATPHPAPEPALAATAVAAGAGTSAAPSANGGAATYSPPGFGASYLHNPKPAYPIMARRRGLEGLVRLDVRVSAEGIPVAVKVRESSGHESLDDAALTAVWHWRFSPARRGGEPIEGVVVVPVRFNLEGDPAG